MYNTNNGNKNIEGTLAFFAQQNAMQYRREVAKKKRNVKCKKVALGILVAAFFITALAIVGKNDLESEGIVLAKESEISCENSEHSIIGCNHLWW